MIWFALMLLQLSLCSDSVVVRLFQNGEHDVESGVEGVEVTLTASQFTSSPDLLDEYTRTLYTYLATTLPISKNYVEPGVFLYPAGVVSGAGVNVTASLQSFTLLRRPTQPADSCLYLVPPGLHFVWPFVHDGHNVTVDSSLIFDESVYYGDQVKGTVIGPLQPPQPVILESLSNYPKVFELHHFFSTADADALIDNIESITDEENKLQRSSVGPKTGAARRFSNVRTSENAFDSVSSYAQRLKRRAFALLRFPFYNEDYADGLQVVRYKQGQAYIAHEDYFGADADPDFNFDPATGGSNRFATVFLYLSTPDAGGQTVFPKARSVPSSRPGFAEFGPESVPEEAASLFEEGTWESRMVDTCYNSFSVKPRRGRAILFYSQRGNGAVDPSSNHGGCPVLGDTAKYGANLWVWQSVRHGITPGAEGSVYVKVDAVFVNEFDQPVDLLWQHQVISRAVQPGGTVRMTTYEPHEWNVVPADTVAPYEPHVLASHTVRLADGEEQRIVFGPTGTNVVAERDEL